jgi:heme exporter protein A
VIPIEIRVENLTCRRGERLLFAGLSHVAHSGRLIEVVGPNGTGKTSFLRILAGLLKAEAGEVTYLRDGQPLGEDEPPSSLIHYAGHLDALKTQMTVRENLGFAASYFSASGDQDAALKRVGLWAQGDLPVAYLSAGQRRRLALARCALIARPVWLLDEPLAALDEPGRRLVTDVIGAHLAVGGLVLAATHEPIAADAERLSIA